MRITNRTLLFWRNGRHFYFGLTLGNYAQAAYLKKDRKSFLTETVYAWKEYLPKYIPLPHPSPLNNIWLSKNIWFHQEVLPVVRKIITLLIE